MTPTTRIDPSLENPRADDTPVEAIHCCTARPTPEGKVVEAALKSIAENPANAPLRRPEPSAGAGPEPAAMALLTERRWKPGRTLKIRFLDGDEAVQRRVVEVARRWEDHANVKLDFGDHPSADLRISFAQPGSWSYLGTTALVIDEPEPTMNFGWLEPGSSQGTYDRVVLHELGHALAAVHEHQHPDGGIPWDEEKVYRYYEATQGWDREKTKRNVLEVYSHSSTNFSSFDPSSIMQYPVPNELTVGDFEVGWNRELSETDRRFAGRMYPFAERRSLVLTPGEAVAAEIAEHGEEDRFTFTVAEGAEGHYRLETTGPTDVVMALYGPDDESRLVESDDDSGIQRNARLASYLAAGGYLVRVRHFWPRGEGGYRLRLDRLDATSEST